MWLELVFFPGHEGYSASSHDVLAGILTESERPHQNRRQYRYYIPRHGQGISAASSKFPVFRAHRRQKRKTWRGVMEKLSAQEILQRLMKLIRRFQMRDMSDIGQLHQARAGNLRGRLPG
jgi:hypothetical protein